MIEYDWLHPGYEICELNILNFLEVQFQGENTNNPLRDPVN